MGDNGGWTRRHFVVGLSVALLILIATLYLVVILGTRAGTG